MHVIGLWAMVGIYLSATTMRVCLDQLHQHAYREGPGS